MFKFDSEEILEDSKSGSFTWGFMRLVFYGWDVFSEYDGQSPAISRLLSKKFPFFKKGKDLRVEVEVNVAVCNRYKNKN